MDQDVLYKGLACVAGFAFVGALIAGPQGVRETRRRLGDNSLLTKILAFDFKDYPTRQDPARAKADAKLEA